MKHGGLAEIIATHKPPMGFVRQDGGDLTTTEQLAFKQTQEAIQAKQARRQGGWHTHFKKIAVGTITDDVKFTQRRPDGKSDWVNNKDFLKHEARKGNPMVTMNPALLGEAAG